MRENRFCCEKYRQRIKCIEDILLKTKISKLPTHKIEFGHMELDIISNIMFAMNVKNILEIGTFVASSAIKLAQEVGSNGKVFTIENSHNNYNLARENIANSGYSQNIQLILGNATDINTYSTIDRMIDLLIIDANKSEYLEYIQKADHLLVKNAAIIIDDVLLFDHIWINPNKNRSQIMAIFIEYMFKNYKSSFIPTNNGMIFAIKK